MGTGINLSIPGFPFPPELRELARWLNSLVGLDISSVLAPECLMGAPPENQCAAAYGPNDPDVQYAKWQLDKGEEPPEGMNLEAQAGMNYGAREEFLYTDNIGAQTGTF